MHSVKRDLLYLKIFKHKNRKKEYCVYLQQRHATTTNHGRQHRKSIQKLCLLFGVYWSCVRVCVSVSVCTIAFIDLCSVSLSIKSFASSVQITN